jgi:hypothetical protein
MNKKAATFLVTAIMASPLFAGGSKSASMTVSVEVLARTILTVDSQPSSVEITDSDVARGYVDLPQSVAFHVRSNAANGYTVQFQPLAGPFSRADINWGNALATVSSDGAWLTQPYRQGTTTATLSVRLTLALGTQPGSYAWPVRFDAGSL